MPRYVAFLRAVNVGGRVVKMDELRRLFSQAGFADVETFIASGNVIFDAKEKAGPKLEAKIEALLHEALGYEVPVFVRPLADVVTACGRKPFPEKAVAPAGVFAVGMLKSPVDPAAQKRLDALDPLEHRFKIVGSELYWLCKVRQSETKLTPGKIERALGGPTTIRSMVSIGKLAAKHCAGK